MYLCYTNARASDYVWGASDVGVIRFAARIRAGDLDAVLLCLIKARLRLILLLLSCSVINIRYSRGHRESDGVGGSIRSLLSKVHC